MYGSAILIVFLQLYPRDPPMTAAGFHRKILHITSMIWSYCPPCTGGGRVGTVWPGADFSLNSGV